MGTWTRALVRPSAVTVAPNGDAVVADADPVVHTLLVTDMWNHRLRAISPSGNVSTWAGSGGSDPTGDPGGSARLFFPLAVAALPSGDVVIAEPGTGFVRAVSGAPAHTVSELAGSMGQHGWSDGPAAAAGVSETLALAERADGQ